MFLPHHSSKIARFKIEPAFGTDLLPERWLLRGIDQVSVRIKRKQSSWSNHQSAKLGFRREHFFVAKFGSVKNEPLRDIASTSVGRSSLS